MKIFGALIILLALAVTPTWAQDDFAKEIYAEIGNSVRAEYETMLAAIARDSLTNPPRDEVSRIQRAGEVEKEKRRVKLLTYNKAALFAGCAAEAARAREPGAPRLRGDQDPVLRACLEFKFDQLRKFANISSYAELFFPQRIAPCEQSTHLPEVEKALPPYEFLEMNEPRIYDLERYVDCVMTPPASPAAPEAR
jgi:hypothetical protein